MDLALIARAQAGDRAALERLLEQIAPLVHRFGLRMCRHEADAEDVLQDTLLSVATHLGEFQGRASLSSWVFALARSACTRMRRGLKNQPHRPQDAAQGLASCGASPEASAADKQTRQALDAALAALSDDYRSGLPRRTRGLLTKAGGRARPCRLRGHGATRQRMSRVCFSLRCRACGARGMP